jgi:carbon-monoxide dehydrogenase medium subunit
MLNLKTIHKPTALEDALKLLRQPETVALAGGTYLSAERRNDVSALVDLSALGLSYIRERDGAIAIGATTTLAPVEESPVLRALACGVIARAAHQSASSILRNQATVAGTLITNPAGVLAVALLALDAGAKIVGDGTRLVPIVDLWKVMKERAGTALIVEIIVPMTNPRASLQVVARTPSDKAIVCVVASARMENGHASDVRIALGGVGDFALRPSAAEQVIQGHALSDAVIENAVGEIARAGLHPRGDFRGSEEYRKEMACVLTRRALKDLQDH